MRNIISKELLLPLADYMAGTKIHGYFKFLEKSQWWPEEKLQDYQNERLRALIAHAFKNVLYYRKLFKKLNLRPTNIRSVEDLSKIPVLTKDIIRKNFKDFISLDCSKRKYKWNSTGGSTGDPLRHLYDFDAWSIDWACCYRGWRWAGWQLGDKIATLAGQSLVAPGGFSLKKLFKNKLLERHLLLPALNLSVNLMEQYAKTITKFRPKIFRGYPSSLRIFAEFVENNRVPLPKFKAILATAETLFPSYRKKIEAVFDAPVFDGYSMRDGGANAMDCDKQNLHISTERAIVEFVRDSKLKKKRIILTDAYNYVFPFIRYDVGDIGLPSNEKCSCGRTLPLIKSLEGRVMDILRFPDGTCWAGPALTLVFREFDVKQYQVIQESLNEVTLKIVKGTSFSKIAEAQLIRVFKKAGAARVNIESMESIDVAPSGKRRFVVSKI